MSCSRHPCLMLPLSLDPACSWHSWNLTDLPVACCLSGHLFLPDISLNFLFWWWHFLSIRFALVIPESWQPLSCWQLGTLEPDTLCSPDNFISLSSVPYFLHFPPLFNYPLFIISLPSSPLYCLDISTVFTSLLSLHPCSLHISFYHYPLAISTVFTSLRSSLLYTLDSWHLYFYLFAISSV